MMLRADVIQRILDLFPAPHYLEVGVQHGVTFKPLRARRKIAVDPQFLFDAVDHADGESRTEHYEITSDEYFGRRADPSQPFDVIFLDGLHTFEQTLRDLMNAVVFLKPQGVIIVDDVVPNSYHAALADTQDLYAVRGFLARFDPRLEADQAWMGDVYKVPFYVKHFMQQFSFATTNDNHGQTVLWREPRNDPAMGARTLEAIGRMEFRDFVKYHGEMCFRSTDEIISLIQAAHRATAPAHG